jgi:uncharacterized protein
MTEHSASRPVDPDIHLFEASSAPHAFLPNGSRVYEIAPSVATVLEAALASGRKTGPLLAQLGLDAPPFVGDESTTAPPLRAISLAIAQKCNLGCTYCYADGGAFGGPATQMPTEVALRTVEHLLGNAQPGERYTLAFLGGEPLINRVAIRAATIRAEEMAAARGCSVGFSITTNGTLVTREDGEFFEEHHFAVTVSLDGIGPAHDRQRPFRNGRGSFDRVMDRVTHLLGRKDMQVTARVTVTPRNLALRETLEGLLHAGFYGVGFSPMLRSPSSAGEMGEAELSLFLDEMIACGLECERHLVNGERYGFSNLLTAVHEIHKGTHRPYPCGAGAGYLGAFAEGDFYACHRFVGEPDARMGSVGAGIDHTRQDEWLTERHVHRQTPCRECWARYLCGGGCHHEVIGRGRLACDYIRGWLHYVLQAYVRLLAARPELFAAPGWPPSSAPGSAPAKTAPGPQG